MTNQQDDPATGASGPQDPAPFDQGPLVPRGVVGLPVLLLVLMLLAPTFTTQVLNSRWVLATLVVVGGLAVVVAVAVLPQSMKSVRVDPRGMHVKGRLALPAKQIGRVRRMSGGEATTWSWPGSRPWGRQRLPSKQNLYGGLYGWGAAVGVEHLGRGEDDTTIWLVPSRDADRLAAALEHVRDQARRPR